MNEPLRTQRAPHCQLFGCIGHGFCDYCGQPIRAARQRLANLIAQLTDTKEAPAA